MKTWTYYLGLSALFLISIAQPAKAQTALDSLLAAHQVPGLALGLIEDGQALPPRYVGERAPGQPLPEKALFNTASLTKSMTAYLVMQLVEGGSLRMSESLAPYWVDPEIADDSRHVLLTPHVILSHQTGFANWRWMEEDGTLQFRFEPGSQFGYSGEGYEYLRRALEAKYHQDFRTLVDSLVFEPLGMHDSHLSWQADLDTARYAGEYADPKTPYAITVTEAGAADDLITTVEDLQRFVVALLKETLPHHPEYFADQIAPRPGLAFSYGWVRMNDLQGESYGLLSAGSDQGVNALLILLPEEGKGMVALTNGDGGRAVVMQLLATQLGEGGRAMLGRF